TFVIFDHARHRVLLIANVILNPGRNPADEYQTALQRLAHLEERLSLPLPPCDSFRTAGDRPRAETSPEEFRDAVRKAQRYIHDGDIFQVVLSQRFSTKFTG